jgi:hypothetical protein
MPRRNDIRATDTAPNAIIASATNFGAHVGAEMPRSKSGGWQDALWSYFDAVGEFEFVANWVGSMLSRARLYPAVDGKEVTEGPAFDAVNELFGSAQGRAAALREMGVHRTVAGEFYIVSFVPLGTTRPVWMILAPQRISKNGSEWKIDGKPILGRELLVMRSFIPHPRTPNEVSSPSRAALPILNEIFRLTQHVDAQVSSRLASAGLMFLPNEMTVTSAANRSDEEEGQSGGASGDVLVRELIATMKTAIVNRNDASALVPIIITAEADAISAVKKVDFWTELDSHALELRQEAIRRLGLAMDVPPEILTGSGDASHWQAWGVDDAAIKAHAEPMLDGLCADLTVGYMWPSLQGVVPDEELYRYSVMSDTSGLRVRPNRSTEAIQLYGLGELSGEALRRETGFDDIDTPTEDERKLWMLRRLAGMAATPEMSAAALDQLSIPMDIQGDSKMRGAVPNDVGADIPPQNAVPGEQERRALETDAKRKSQSAALTAAAEQMVFRAMERAGNRVKTRMKFAPDGVEPSESYLFKEWTDAEASFMLDGSFAQCDRFAAQLGVSSDWLAGKLEAYCRELIVNREHHTAARLERFLGKESANVR